MNQFGTVVTRAEITEHQAKIKAWFQAHDWWHEECRFIDRDEWDRSRGRKTGVDFGVSFPFRLWQTCWTENVDIENEWARFMEKIGLAWDRPDGASFVFSAGDWDAVIEP